MTNGSCESRDRVKLFVAFRHRGRGIFILENRRKQGGRYEQIAARFLEQNGYQILEQNYHCRYGEVDLIAKHQSYLVFVEVKYRKTAAYGMPEEAVDCKKQRSISKVAQNYLFCCRYGSQTPVRFDVVVILGNQIQLYPNAFEYLGIPPL